jgi:hypothetical protein
LPPVLAPVKHKIVRPHMVELFRFHRPADADPAPIALPPDRQLHAQRHAAPHHIAPPMTRLSELVQATGCFPLLLGGINAVIRGCLSQRRIPPEA